MPYWIRGRDSQTGGPTAPFFSAADNEAAARTEAISPGMVVELAVRLIEEQQPEEKPQSEQDSRARLLRRRFQFGQRRLVVFVLRVTYRPGGLMISFSETAKQRHGQEVSPC